MRTIIDLPQVQVDALDAHCRREGISRAEAIRRAVTRELRHQAPPDAAAAFGLWRGRRGDGLSTQRRLRREWDR